MTAVTRYCTRVGSLVTRRRRRVSPVRTRCDVTDVAHPDLAVADLPGARRRGDGGEHGVDLVVVDDELDVGLRHQLDAVLGAAVGLGVPALAAEALDLARPWPRWRRRPSAAAMTSARRNGLTTATTSFMQRQRGSGRSERSAGPPRGGSRGRGRCGWRGRAGRGGGAGAARGRRGRCGRARRRASRPGPSASRLTTAPKRSSRAPVSRASTGGSGTQAPPKRSTPSSSSVGGATADRARRRRSRASTRACRSTSSAGTLIQSSSSSPTDGRRLVALDQQQPGDAGSCSRALGRVRVGGPPDEDDVHGAGTYGGTVSRLFRRREPSTPCTVRAATVAADRLGKDADHGGRDTYLDHLGSIALFSALSRKELQRVAKASDEVDGEGGPRARPPGRRRPGDVRDRRRRGHRQAQRPQDRHHRPGRRGRRAVAARPRPADGDGHLRHRLHRARARRPRVRRPPRRRARRRPQDAGRAWPARPRADSRSTARPGPYGYGPQAERSRPATMAAR